MSKSRTSAFWNYVAECVRLLYWSCFKPYTFERWLRDIHPELKPQDNPFTKRIEFSTNPHLRRYAEQVSWLIAVVPIFAVLLAAPIYTLVTGQSFDWLISCNFCLGWFLGRFTRNLLECSDKEKLVIWLFIIFIFIWILKFLPGMALSAKLSLVSSVALGMTLNILIILLIGVAFSLFIGMPIGILLGLDFSVALLKKRVHKEEIASKISKTLGAVVSISIGVFVGLLTSIMSCLVLGIAIGKKQGVEWSVLISINVLVISVFSSLLRVCLWLPELLWIFLLFLYSKIDILFSMTEEKNLSIDFLDDEVPNFYQIKTQAKYLSYLPHRFDELIILPLPFLEQMIAEAYQDNSLTALETIDYLITSTNQQKVAVQAMLTIAADIFNSCQRLEDIVDIANQLTWVPSPLPKELGFVLPPFLDISQSVRASQQATTFYRRYELLNPPISALNELKNTLAFGKNASLATKFGSISDRWLTILQLAQRTLEETARQSQEIRQVYIAGNSLDPETAKYRFKGRIDIFREIETLTLSDQPPVLLLYGGRRTGKTSALKYLPYKVTSDIIPLLIDVQGAASATTIKGFTENLAQQIIDTARRLPRKLHLPNPDSSKLNEDPFPALQTWLAEIERSHSGKRFLLCLDEFERLSEVVNATNSRAPLNFIRHLLQHQKQWILLFSGSHLLSELDAYWSDYLINTRALRMTYLQESEVRELILKPVEDFTNIYEPEAVDKIIQITCCQPYLVQLVCYELVELLNRDIRANRRQPNTAKATVADVQDIIPIVLERGDQYFRELWTSLEESDRNLLRRLIDGETPTPQDSKIVKKLSRKEILTPEGNTFQVPLVERFVEYLLEEE